MNSVGSIILGLRVYSTLRLLYKDVTLVSCYFGSFCLLSLTRFCCDNHSVSHITSELCPCPKTLQHLHGPCTGKDDGEVGQFCPPHPGVSQAQRWTFGAHFGKAIKSRPHGLKSRTNFQD